MSIPEQSYYNAFNLLPQIGPVRFKKLRTHFPTLKLAWEADAQELRAAGLEEKVAANIVTGRKLIDPETEYARLEKEGVRLITAEDEEYPRELLEIPAPPAMLYLKGTLLPDEFRIGIVGSRKISDYGKRVAEDFSRGLAGSGVTLVSGMAYGVDSIVHYHCLKAKGRTVAVLGSGLDEKSIYPSSNRRTAEEIAVTGCLLSEYPLGTPPLRQNFPARNRIISGISKGVLVIEASLTSGSLITARFALEQNREVFAVPGSIYSKNSEGTHNLIRMGARAVTRAEELLEEFNLLPDPQTAEARQILPENSEEKLILENLSADEPLHIDKLAQRAAMKTAALSSLLTLMEMKGMVRDIGGMRYIKK